MWFRYFYSSRNNRVRLRGHPASARHILSTIALYFNLDIRTDALPTASTEVFASICEATDWNGVGMAVIAKGFDLVCVLVIIALFLNDVLCRILPRPTRKSGCCSTSTEMRWQRFQTNRSSGGIRRHYSLQHPLIRSVCAILGFQNANLKRHVFVFVDFNGV